MGTITTIKAIKEGVGAEWYAANKLSELPCPEFPYEVAFNRRVLEKNPDLHRTIRKFVEHQLRDTVIISYLGLSYYYEYQRFANGYQITHGYDQFFFESEESAILFKLQFAEHITDVKLRWDPRNIPWDKVDQPQEWTPPKRGYY
jgi:hypothetical protein